MQKRTIPLIAGSVIMAILAILSINTYLAQQRRSISVQTREELARRQAMQANVLVAKQNILKGATIEEGMFELKTMPKEYVQPMAARYPERIIGLKTIAEIVEGEQITLSKLLSPREAAVGSSLAMATPVGKRAISIPVDNVSSLMGMIKPGDYVDVIGFIPIPVQTADGQQQTQVEVMPLFQNVSVLAMGRSLSAVTSEEGSRYKKDKDEATTSMITLALSPQEANFLAFIQEQGKIRLTLRSPADSQIQPIQSANWQTLFQYLFPQMHAPMLEEEGLLADKGPEVEVYRGLNREVMYLSE